jgi:hypothetical protein
MRKDARMKPPVNGLIDANKNKYGKSVVSQIYFPPQK